MEERELLFLTEKARHIRKLTIDAIGFLGVGHIGGAMSIVDVLTVLYYKYMHIDPARPQMVERDRLVLSKGHAGPALYSILADKGYFPIEWLHTLNKGGTNLPSHCDMNLTPGIDMTTGSLGQGISSAIGLALGMRLDKINNNVFLIIGDGESNEGQIWEGAMSAAQFGLSNLIAFTDYNKLQIDGYLKEIMDVEDIVAKWKAFGWFVQRVSGHDLTAMSEAIELAQKETARPSMIILDTIKGKGASFAEGKPESHNMNFNMETAEDAIKKLDE